MSTILKYAGVFVQLVGVGVLAIPAISSRITNTDLAIGLSLIIVGYLGHIVLNKILES
ncbi:MAG: hypothetical protein LBB90_10160 [Tannerella sp.]|jgi:hypothetical protein|nr:hypothetical protein [Tannerella sp.]